MSLKVLSNAFPVAPVSADAVGGVEQIFSWFDAALIALVDSLEEMAQVVCLAHKLPPFNCRRAAMCRFSLDRMVRAFLALQAALTHRQPLEAVYA